MADLYGVGCRRCNAEIAAAYERMPQMAEYLDSEGYEAANGDVPDYCRPLPRVDGVFKPHTIATVSGDDGWLICLHRDMDGKPHICPCEPMDVCVEVWRGKVEIR